MTPILLIAALLPPIIWGMNVWGGWAQRAATLRADVYLSGAWLKLLRIEPSLEHRITFIRISSFVLLLAYTIVAGGFLLLVALWH